MKRIKFSTSRFAWIALGLWVQFSGVSGAAQTPSTPSASLEALARDASLVLNFDPQSDEAALSALRAGVFSAIGLEKHWERFNFLTQLSTSPDRRLAVVGFDPEGEAKRAAAILVWGEFSTKTQHALELSAELTGDRKDFRVVTFSDLAIFGDAVAVDRCVRIVKAGGAAVTNPGGILEVARKFSPGLVWGALGPAWHRAQPSNSLNCDAAGKRWSLICAIAAVRWTAFSARSSSSLDLEVATTALNSSAARLLAEELEIGLAPPQFRPPRPLEKAAADATIRTDAETVSVQLKVGSEDLSGLASSSLMRSLLTWGLNGAQREGWQEIPRIFVALRIREGSQVADLGAGNGYMTARLARAVGEQGGVWAVDISPDALETLRKRKADGPYPQIRVVEGGEKNPRLPKRALDGVLIVNAYHEMTKYRSILKHIYRSLKPGGRLVLVEPYNPDTRSAPRAEQVRVHDIAPELVEAEIRSAGFSIIEREDDFIDNNKSSLLIGQRPRP